MNPLTEAIEHLDMHAHRDVLPDWVCVPAVEWDAVMPAAIEECRRVAGVTPMGFDAKAAR